MESGIGLHSCAFYLDIFATPLQVCRMINWNDLRVALAVCREGTLGGAGRVLGVDQTTVTRRLTALERGLGARLFERREGRLVPTAAGEQVIDRAERAEAELAALERDVAGRDARPGGQVRVTAVPTLANRLLAPNAGALFDRFPDLRLDLIAEPALLSVTRREADIAIRLARPDEDAMIARRMGSMLYAVYARRGLDAASLPWITYEDSFSGIPQARWIAREGKKPLSPLKVNDGEPILQAARQGLGRTLLPVFVGDADPKLQKLSGPVTGRDVWLVVHPHVRRSARVEAAVDWIGELFATLKKDGAAE